VNTKLVEDIANAVLYEGYMLYPYRPSSVKNRQRWNFGVVYPRAYSEMQSGADSWFMQTECLATSGAGAAVSVKVRFLQGIARTIGEPKESIDDRAGVSGSGREPDLQIVETLRVGEQVLQTWEEAIEREIILPPVPLNPGAVETCSALVPFRGGRELEPVRGLDGNVAAFIVRTKNSVSGQVDVTATPLQENLFKVTVRVSNATATDPASVSRAEALMRSLLSAHTILSIEGGEFVSLLDPPVPLKEFVSQSSNIGTWPVLAGEESKRDTMLSSPIILYDFPQIAPESPGNLFDGTEIDEILALRILTLTEDEKLEMRSADPRARQILERTESLPAEHFMKLHGVLRGLRPADAPEEKSHE
jgi:hydrogenase maturation protease